MATAPSRRWHAEYSMRELKQLELGRKSVFVNVGSGPGVHTVGAALRGARAIGLDADKANVLRGRRLAKQIAALGKKGGEALADMASFSGRESAKFLTDARGSAENAQFMHFSKGIPLKDDSANKVLSLDYIHTLPPRAREGVLLEILRIARPGAHVRLMSKSYPVRRGLVKGAPLRSWMQPGALRGEYVMVSASEHFAILAAKQGVKLSYSLQRGRPTAFRIVRK